MQQRDAGEQRLEEAVRPRRQTIRGGADLPPPDGFNLVECGAIFWRRKVLIGFTVLTITLGAMALILQLTPLYTAAAYVALDPRERQVLSVQAALSGLPFDVNTLAGEVEIIRSRDLAAGAITRLGLRHEPEFNPNLREPGGWDEWLNKIVLLFEDWRPAPLGDDGDAALDELKALAVVGHNREMAQTIDKFLSQLDVAAVGQSPVIRIAFQSESPFKAALVANTIADLYLVSQVEAKFESAKGATDWLNERIGELREQATALAWAVEVYRDKHGIVQGAEAALISEQVSELTTQLLVVQAERAEAEAEYAHLKKRLNEERPGASIYEVLDSPLIQTLRGEEAEVARRIAELAQDYGERHPLLAGARAELQDVRATIAREVDRIVERLRREVMVQISREEALVQLIEKVKADIGGQNTAAVQLRALEQEAEASQALLEHFLARAKEIGAQTDAQEPDARIISLADVPEEASFPNRKLLGGLSFMLASCVGVFLAFLIEVMDRSVRSTDQVEHYFGARPLGLVPLLKGRDRHDGPARYVAHHPHSAVGEAIQNLHTGLGLFAASEATTLLFTSALPGEGKSSLVLASARLLADTGQRVVAVDCDLRKRSLSETTGSWGDPGVTDFISGQATLDQIIVKDKDSRADFVPAGFKPSSATMFLASLRMQYLISELAARYDLVLVDSPPVLAVSDARLLGASCNATVFLVRWGRTHRERALAGMRQLTSSGVDVAGMIITMVDTKKHAQYRYSDSGDYHGPSTRYYTP